MKTALITGVAGFVGSNLAGELLLRRYRVKGMDNLSQGNKGNIASILKNPDFSFYEADVRDANAVCDISKDVDCIAHLAAFKIPRYGGASNTLTINTKGTENVLEAARRNKAKVLFSSTSDVYGKNPQLPFNENSDLLLGPTRIGRWAYAVSKIYDEHLCLAYGQEYGVSAAIVRYFGGYGPGQNLTWWGGPQSVFIDCALKKEPIPVHGDGRQTRSFIYVSDMVAGTIAAMEKEESIGEVFNIGNPQQIAIIELARMIWKMINDTEPIIEFVPYKNFARGYEDVPNRVPDITKAKEVLYFEPKVDLEDGLQRTIQWQRQFVK